MVDTSKLYYSVWEPPIMYLAWKISRSLGRYVDIESVPLMKRQGVANIFHARCVILTMSVYSLVIA